MILTPKLKNGASLDVGSMPAYLGPAYDFDRKSIPIFDLVAAKFGKMWPSAACNVVWRPRAQPKLT